MNVLFKRLLITVGLFNTGAMLGGCCGSASSASGPSTTSQSGSTAAMLPYGNVLYALNNNSRLITFDISDPTTPKETKNIVTSGSETLFISEGYLYVGGVSGVDIYDISTPQTPQNVAFYSHQLGCDPIIVNDDIGYITIRNRGGCWRNAATGISPNRLEITNFEDPENPVSLAHFDLTAPFGLTFIEDRLAICENYAGLTMLDINFSNGKSNAPNIQKVGQFPNIQCFDLIADGTNLIATASDGIYQFQSENNHLTLRSKIPVGIQ